MAQWGEQSQAAPSSSAQLGGGRPPAWSASEWAAKGVPPVMRHSGSPTKAALALQMASTGRQARSTCFAGCFRSPARPAAPRPPRVGPGLPAVRPGPLGKGSPCPCHGTDLVAVTHQASWHPKGRSLTVPLPCEQAPLSVPGMAGRGLQTQPTPRTLCPWLTKDLSNSGKYQSSPGQREKNPKKTKESILPKQCLHKSVSHFSLRLFNIAHFLLCQK